MDLVVAHRPLRSGISGARRVLGLLLLLALLTSGPAHVWHHLGAVEGASGTGDSDHQCLPCFAFSHLWFVSETPVQVPAVLVRAARPDVCRSEAPSSRVVAADPSRAPPA